MITKQIKNYSILKTLFSGSQSIVYQGFSHRAEKSVIIKCLNTDDPSNEQIARFKREYELIKQLDGKGSVVAYEYVENDNNFAIIMEDYAYPTLKEYLSKNKLSLRQFLNLALALTHSLELIHQHHIIHKDINPANILWNETKKEAKIIDFGIASTLSREEPEMQKLQTLEGSLLYISPEQTGRMNRGIDYRTDYYSLGVIFYEVLTGKLPFYSRDPMEIIHWHIAQKPIPPKQLNYEIPQIISDIVLKLLAKAAEDRYQSTFGLKKDLLKCLESLQQKGVIEPFTLGAEDLSRKFRIAEKLYGRKKEREALLEAFTRVCETGVSEMLMVSGYSGVGKSRLIHEVHQPITAKNGYFISGKYDQYQRSVPYYAIIQAMKELVHQILTENEKNIKEWRNKLNEALGVNAQVILDVIPELEAIIGPQPKATVLGLTETQNRFNLIFQNFIHMLASKDKPLVLFLDDLQWIDNASLNLLTALLINLDNRYLLMIGSYRENEVEATHPLLMMLKKLEDAGVKLTNIILQPLQLEHINQLLTDALHRNEEDLKELAYICFEKTHGNPFFLIQFLNSLYKEQLIKMDVQKGGWSWNVHKIKMHDYTDNVVEFMTRKVRGLSKATQQVLQLAACLGNRFSLSMLAIISEQSRKATADALLEAIEEGLVMPVDDSYQAISESFDQQVNYLFLHDRVQQAAYSLIEEKKRNALHLKIGRLLLQKITPEEQPERLTEIVSHLNQGLSLVTNPEEIMEIINLNLITGRKANQAIAYKPALHHFKTAIALLPSGHWETHYALSLSLYTEAFETSYLVGELAEMDSFSEILFKHAKSILDKIKIYEIKLNYLSGQNRFNDAVDLAIEALSLFNIKLPKNPNKLHVFFAILRIKLLLLGRSKNTLANLPKMTNENWLAAMRILASAGTVSYLAKPYMCVLVIYQLIRLSMKYGLAPQTANSYIGYATLLSTLLKDPNQGYEYGQLGIRIVDERQYERQKPQVYMVFCMVIALWKIHLDEILPILINTFQQGMDVGDLENSGFKAAGIIAFSFASGKELSYVNEEAIKYGNLLLKFGQITSFKYLLFYWVAALRLMDTSEEKINAVGAFYNEEKVIAEAKETHDFSALTEIYWVTIIYNYFNKEYQTAAQAVFEVDQYLEGPAETQITGPLIYVYGSLALLAYYPAANAVTKQNSLRLVQKYLRKLKLRAKQAPMNYLHKYYLVLGSYYAALANYDEGLKYLDLAIINAKENRYINEEAIANELAAHIYLGIKKEIIAKGYMHEAHYCYSRWGAVVKVKQIENEYGYLLVDKVESHDVTQTMNYMKRSNRLERANETLDLATITKSAQAISKEIVFGNLLKKMMAIVIENAGAEKGYLLLGEDGKWLIQAECTIDTEATVLQSRPIENNLPISVIHYVIRTKSPTVIADALHDNKFNKDPYITASNAKSILCMPLLKGGILIGILYLENHLAINVFTQEQLDLLNLLSGQIVIAIDNARLYTNTILLNEALFNLNKTLSDLNKAYERFVPHEFLKLLGKKSIIEVTEGDNIQKDMTILFSDIRNFTSLSEKMSSRENFLLINEFLSYIGPQISTYHGFVDKYYGDGIMALFPTNADDALQSAISMLYMVKKFNANRREQHKETMEIGIGLNSGVLMLGTVGGANRMDVTVISDTVNVASRIEELTKYYQVALLVSDEVYKRLKNPTDYAMRKIDVAYVKGRTLPIGIYEVFEADEGEIKRLKSTTLDFFAQALLAFQNNDIMRAQNLFKQIYYVNPHDLPVQYYLQRCEQALKDIKI